MLNPLSEHLDPLLLAIKKTWRFEQGSDIIRDVFQDDYIEQQGVRWISPEETLKRDPKDSELHKAWAQKKTQDWENKKFWIYILRDHSWRLAKNESTKQNRGGFLKELFM